MMKRSTSLWLACMAAVMAVSPRGFGQGTAFTYQGRLNDSGGPAKGSYDLQFVVFDSGTNGNKLSGSLQYTATAVSNGLFTVTLDFGSGMFTGADRWLEIAVRTNGNGTFTTLAPRQALTASPYALFAGAATSLSGTVAASQIAGMLSNTALPGSPTFSGAVQATGFIGNGAGLSNVNATTLNGLAATNFWKTAGNSGTSPTNGSFLGTMDAQPLEMRVGNARALRLEPAYVPNLIGGATNNYVTNGVNGAVIGGGGLSNAPNRITDDYSFIGGGTGNQAGNNSGGTTDAINAVVAGGNANTASGQNAFVGGGGNNSASGGNATVSGGFANSAVGLTSTIAGGWGNSNNLAAGWATIGGGRFNVVGAVGATVGGGSFNVVAGSDGFVGGGGSNTNLGPSAVLVGGNGNRIDTNGSVASIGGGGGNIASAFAGTVGGGYFNTNVATYGTIGGGGFNSLNGTFGVIAGGCQNALSNSSAVIGGGYLNVNNGYLSTIPGGYSNLVLGDFSFAAGQRAQALHTSSFVWNDTFAAAFSSSGSNQFLIHASGGVGIGLNNPSAALDVAGQIKAAGMTLSSGTNLFNVFNTADTKPLALRVNGQTAMRFESTSDTPNVIGGFGGNSVQAGLPGVTIGGGGTALGNQPNVVTNNGYYATIGGGYRNTVTNYGGAILGGSVNYNGGTFGTIGAGQFNTEMADFSGIGGGQYNTIDAGASFSTIAGGLLDRIYASSDHATIAGGHNNEIFHGPYGFIGGGYQNLVQARGGVVAGGTNNQAGSFTSGGICSGIGAGAKNLVTGDYASIAGGFRNNVSGDYSFISGGTNNDVSGFFSGIGGGFGNSVSGDYSYVAGGAFNDVSGFYSLAAGRRAKAQHNGTFVWADSSNADFSSATNNEFIVRASNGVGINTATPYAPLHILNQGNFSVFQPNPAALAPTLLMDDISSSKGGNISFASQGAIQAVIDVRKDFWASGWGMAIGPAGNEVLIGTTGIHVDGNITAFGNITAHSYSTLSDRNAKTNFTAINPLNVLERVVALPITTWNFKSEEEILHLGPMAQDFYAAFGLGADEKHITTVDEEGVALAAIQGLNQKIEERDAEIASLKKRLERIEQLLEQATIVTP